MVDPGWIAGRLRELRTAAGLTQQELAERVGVKREAVARWEKGDQEPGWSYVLALAAALGVDCTAFAQEPAVEAEPRKAGRPRKDVSSTDGPQDEATDDVEEPAEEKPKKGKRKAK